MEPDDDDMGRAATVFPLGPVLGRERALWIFDDGEIQVVDDGGASVFEPNSYWHEHAAELFTAFIRMMQEQGQVVEQPLPAVLAAVTDAEHAANAPGAPKRQHMHDGKGPLEPPDDLWERAKVRSQELITYVEKTYGRAEHVMSLGGLMAGVALMKATGASEDIVLSYAERMYKRMTFMLVS